MKISFHTLLGSNELTTNMGFGGFNSSMPLEKAKIAINKAIGFGQASIKIIESLEELGIETVFDAPADASISFNHPTSYQFSNSKLKIGYTPWESNAIPAEWKNGLDYVDELWVTAPIVKQWFERDGFGKPIYVYQHGIDPVWTPKKREVKDAIRFLHVGEPAPRKGGELALKAFRAAFGKAQHVHLTIKAHKYSDIRLKDRWGSIIGYPQDLNNVTLITDEYPLASLVNLFHRNTCLVYPSFGEGFGLIPLQAMASGMPTICTEAWAPYAKHLLPKLRLGSTLGRSPWDQIHPGDVYFPKFDDLVDMYRYVADNYETVSTQAFNRSARVHEDYDWVQLTRNVFNELEQRI